MGLLPGLIMSLIHLIVTAIDLLFLLTLIRVLSRRWNNPLLCRCDSVGKPLVDWFTVKIEQLAGRFTKKCFSQTQLLIISMLVLMISRFLLVGLFTW